MKKWLLFIFFSVVAAGLLLLAMEGAGRLYMHFCHGVPGKRYGIYMPDKELGAVHRPSSYNSNSQINNWGFRDSEDISRQKPAGSLRIYCSGGSTTFCYNLPTDQAWPMRLQAKLRAMPGHGKDQVLNAGEIVFSTTQEFLLAKRLIPVLKPDIVILYGSGINEINNAMLLMQEGKGFDQLLKDAQWGVYSRNLDQAKFFKQNSVLVKFFDYYVVGLLKRKQSEKLRTDDSYGPPLNHPWITENFEHSYREYLDYLNSQGVKVIIVRYGDDGQDNWFMRYVRELREKAVAIGREKGAEIWDMASIVEQSPRRREYFIDSGLHVTGAGAELISDGLLPVVAAHTAQ